MWLTYLPKAGMIKLSISICRKRIMRIIYLLYVVVGMMGLFVSLEGLALLYESRPIALGTYTMSLGVFAYGVINTIRNN